MHMLDVWFQWPKVRLILWPPIIGQWEINPSVAHQVRQLYLELSHIRLLLMIHVQILGGDLHRGHLGSDDFTNRFLLITHDWKELQTWAWSHCACLVKAHGLILEESTCDLTWSWPEVKYWPDRSRPNGACFDALWEKHDGARIRPLAYLVQKLFAKKHVCKKTALAFFEHYSG